MQTFMNQNFLLETATAQTLYHDFAKNMPIIDYHCHVNPSEIAQNRTFETITQVWLGGDHYKWRMIRSNGTDERLITGKDSTDYEKFMAFATAWPKAIGNPLYHWTHLELQRYFECHLTLSPATAEEIWHLCNQKLQEDGLSVRGMIAKSNVTAIATTDDPIDSLVHHAAIAKDTSFATKVVPSFRPDKAINLEKPEFASYIASLGQASGIAITSLDDVLAALCNRIDYFDSMGCKAADHGLDFVPFHVDATLNTASIFQKALQGSRLTAQEIESYKTAMMVYLGKEYHKRGWVMQLHYGAIRNTNSLMFQQLGADTGFDAISTRECSQNIANLLNALATESTLPKTVLYSLNPNDDAMLSAMIGCFQSGEIAGKIQHGSAWWFNDTKTGMEQQLISLASRGVLGNFIGMLTDSRSFLSYTRHEYFRRILCNVIGGWVEKGAYPSDMAMLGKMVQDISYHNTKRYFGF